MNILTSKLFKQKKKLFMKRLSLWGSLASIIGILIAVYSFNRDSEVDIDNNTIINRTAESKIGNLQGENININESTIINTINLTALRKESYKSQLTHQNSTELQDILTSGYIHLSRYTINKKTRSVNFQLGECPGKKCLILGPMKEVGEIGDRWYQFDLIGCDLPHVKFCTEEHFSNCKSKDVDEHNRSISLNRAKIGLSMAFSDVNCTELSSMLTGFVRLRAERGSSVEFKTKTEKIVFVVLDDRVNKMEAAIAIYPREIKNGKTSHKAPKNGS